MRFPALYAALATPIGEQGKIDLAVFDKLCDFVAARGVDGVCIGGATAEYPRFELDERKALIWRAARRLPPDTTMLVAIGAPSVERMVTLGAEALDAGAEALLLPMPAFFRYQQQDLEATARHLARTLRAPCFLYDLPEFTNPIDTATVVDLLTSEEHIVGIKDSSGRPENLVRYVEARGGNPWTLIMGDDRHSLASLEAGWDGGISGLACCCPELLVALYEGVRAGDHSEARRCQGLLDQLIARVAVLPVPWGVRVVLRARGIDTGPLPLPLSEERQGQIQRLEAWASDWIEDAGIARLRKGATGDGGARSLREPSSRLETHAPGPDGRAGGAPASTRR